jgi:hypothetical protein
MKREVQQRCDAHGSDAPDAAETVLARHQCIEDDGGMRSVSMLVQKFDIFYLACFE